VPGTTADAHAWRASGLAEHCHDVTEYITAFVPIRCGTGSRLVKSSGDWVKCRREGLGVLGAEDCEAGCEVVARTSTLDTCSGIPPYHGGWEKWIDCAPNARRYQGRCARPRCLRRPSGIGPVPQRSFIRLGRHSKIGTQVASPQRV
jgi:hypothetical protein